MMTSPTVAGIIKKHAEESPGKLALIEGRNTLNYGQLFDRISRLRQARGKRQPAGRWRRSFVRVRPSKGL